MAPVKKEEKLRGEKQFSFADAKQSVGNLALSLKRGEGMPRGERAGTEKTKQKDVRQRFRLWSVCVCVCVWDAGRGY